MLKRIFAGLIAVAITASMVPAMVFADEAENGTKETTAVEENETKEEEKKPAAEDKKPAEEEKKSEDKKDEEASEVKGAAPSEADKVAEQAAKKKKKQPFSYNWNGTTLTISGDCKMPSWKINEIPWNSYKKDIKKVVIKKGITSITSYAFNDCENLTSVTIPSTVKTIGDEAFSGTALTSVSIPNGVKSIGNSAFRHIATLKKANIPASVTSMEPWVFAETGLTDVTISNGVKTLAKGTFYDCNYLEKVTIPSSVTTIENQVFEYCDILKSVKIPYGVKTIGDYAFCDCAKLKVITIPSSVTYLGSNCFECSGLEMLYLSSDLYCDMRKSNPAAFAGIDINEVGKFLNANYMIVNGKTASVKYKKLKKKNQTISTSKLFDFSLRGQGSMIFTKKSGSKKITVNRTSGKITVKKKLKKGTYKIKVKVLATGNDTYRDSGWKTVNITIKVK